MITGLRLTITNIFSRQIISAADKSVSVRKHLQDVIEIPTNVPVQRVDLEDVVYKTQKEKFRAVCDAIEEAHERHQPVLVGTITICQ